MLAVLGLVVAFSLSSTLVKRAETPGVLVALWRMVAVSLVWNIVLWTTGRRVTMRDVSRVWLPGVFFGLNLAVFFAGATHNSIANAALIGSCAPFLIVPVGAWLFGEYIDPRALDTTRELGGALGVAVVGSLMASIYAGRLPAGASAAARDSLGAAVAEEPALAAAAREAFVHAMSRASLVVALVAAAGAVVAARHLPVAAGRGEGARRGATSGAATGGGP